MSREVNYTFFLFVCIMSWFTEYIVILWKFNYLRFLCLISKWIFGQYLFCQMINILNVEFSTCTGSHWFLCDTHCNLFFSTKVNYLPLTYNGRLLRIVQKFKGSIEVPEKNRWLWNNNSWSPRATELFRNLMMIRNVTYYETQRHQLFIGRTLTRFSVGHSLE